MQSRIDGTVQREGLNDSSARAHRNLPAITKRMPTRFLHSVSACMVNRGTGCLRRIARVEEQELEQQRRRTKLRWLLRRRQSMQQVVSRTIMPSQPMPPLSLRPPPLLQPLLLIPPWPVWRVPATGR